MVRSKVYTLLCVVSLAVMLLIPTTHGYRARDERLRAAASNGRLSQSNHLRTVEHSIDIMDTKHAKYASGRLDSRRQMKRETDQCSQERLDALLRSCEEAASFTPTSSGSGNNSTPLFCGQNCSHLAIAYANECSGQELLVNISGACKLESDSSNITIECIYAVVIVKLGITTCTKMLQDVEHEDLDLDDSVTLVEEKCCSLQTEYECDVMHDVYVDRDTGRLVTDPPLVPPWLRGDANQQALQDVLSGCSESLYNINATVEDTETAATTYTEYTSTRRTHTPNVDIVEDHTAVSGAVHVIHWSCITIIAILCGLTLVYLIFLCGCSYMYS